MNNVSELPVGQFDAVKTLEDILQMAKDGDLNRVVIVCEGVPERGDKSMTRDPQVYWSEMPRYEVLWLVRLLNSFVDHRYFSMFHVEPDNDPKIR